MSDKLKKFIQQSKSRFDLADPTPDLFEKILSKMDHQKSQNKKPLKFYNKQWLTIAASISILISCWIYFLKDDNKISSVATTINSIPTETSITKPTHPETKETGISENFQGNNNPVIPVSGIQNPEKGNTPPEPNSGFSIPDLSNQITKKVTEPVTSRPDSEINFSGPILTNTSLENANVFEKSNQLQSIPIQFQKQEEVALLADSVSKEIISSIHPVISKETEISDINTDSTITNKEKEINIAASINESAQEAEPSIQKTIRKGFFKFLSKKAKKWTGNALSIQEIDKGDQLVLAVRYKDDKIEVSKNFRLGHIQE